MKPLRLEPVYKDTIWANHRLSDIRHLSSQSMGIAREVCAYKGSENIVASGPYKGEKISQVIAEHHDELMGEDPNTQLLRAAYMDSKEDLSIQVHPNAEQAAEIGDYEKTESWYILEAEPGAKITAGVSIDDKAVLREAAENGTLEQYLITHPVKPGDFVLIPANLVHANGAGMLVIEFGSFGGITYRLYDYGRPRPLDLDHSFEIMNTKLRTEVTHHPLPAEPTAQLQNGVDCDKFSVDILDVKDSAGIGPYDDYYVIVCVAESCVLKCDEEEYPLAYTESILIPAHSSRIEVKGSCRLLLGHYKAKGNQPE